jgi:hypothetical protein
VTRYSAVLEATVNPLWMDMMLTSSASNQAIVELRSQAIFSLQKMYPKLKVSLTVPVGPSGLPPHALSLLTSAKQNGVRIDG